MASKVHSLQPRSDAFSATGVQSALRFDQLAISAEVICDFIAAAIGLIGAYGIYRLLGLGRGIVYTPRILVLSTFIFAVLFVIMLDREGVYRRGSGMLRISETERILRVSVQAFFLLLPVAILAAHLLSRWLLGISFFLTPMVVVTEKQLLFSAVRYLHSRGRGVRKAIIYGAGFTGKRIFSVLLRSRKLGICPVVFVDDDESVVGKTIYTLGYHREESASVIRGPITSDLLREYGAEVILAAIPSLSQDKLSVLASVAKDANVLLTFVPTQDLYEDAWITYVDIDGIILAKVSDSKSMLIYERAKRLIDIILSVVALIIFSPLLIIIGMAVRMDSEGPAIFKQDRVGRDGKIFQIYKFRSMRVDSPVYECHPQSAGDLRVTRVGRIIRKLSLDELPQLINVIKGEMSLVGPRPEMPFIVDMYRPRERKRLSVTPGITGLWQLSADRSYPIHENPQYDLYYVRNRGFFMDIAILLHTVIFAIRGI